MVQRAIWLEALTYKDLRRNIDCNDMRYFDRYAALGPHWMFMHALLVLQPFERLKLL